ncbi:unnamed protein product [Dibothriocephalus latus]|uniref:Uncharacterized protein n=1 Tax=Dibothriocephalus latus TaxID=60516 RepID=A0A3P7LFZ1_DIBLA|nr:unnamed protein product [Dibothriocephalus latus]
MKDIEHPELAETEWLLMLYYLVDMIKYLNQLNIKMKANGNTVLPLQQAVFPFENELELFSMDPETDSLLNFEKLRQYKDACIVSKPTQNFGLRRLADFTSYLLQPFRARFGDFHENTRLFEFIIHPTECSLNTVDLSNIPGVPVRDSEEGVADLKAPDTGVYKFKSLNGGLERIARAKAE